MPKIEICSNCNGTGIIYERTSAYDSEESTCGRCNGSGKVIIVTKILPYTDKTYKEEISK